MSSLSTSRSRSHPSLHDLPNISLAPLSSHYPITGGDSAIIDSYSPSLQTRTHDYDDGDSADYFTDAYYTPGGGTSPIDRRRGSLEYTAYTPLAATIGPGTSYLAGSVSVPGTPGILGYGVESEAGTRRIGSRSRSRGTGAGGSKSLAGSYAQLSGLALTSTSSKSGEGSRHAASTGHYSVPATPGPHPHHHPNHARKQHKSTRSDPAWLLRVAATLATSTREEKGQSWLSKRESSTSLVDDGAASANSTSASSRHGSGEDMRRLQYRDGKRSGASTPRAARSRGGSRRGSKVGLFGMGMTGLDGSGAITSPSLHRRKGDLTLDPTTSSSSTTTAGMKPDFTDPSSVAEFAALEQHPSHSHSHSLPTFDPSDEDSSSDSDVDEAELQRLTRARGFGLGSWIDSFVEWSLFSVDEAAGSVLGSGITDADAAAEVGESSRGNERERRGVNFGYDDDDKKVKSDHHGKTAERDEEEEGENGEERVVEEVLTPPPDEEGGVWDDAGWVLRVVRDVVF